MKIKIPTKEIESITNLSLGSDGKFYFDIEGKWYHGILFPIYTLILFILSLVAYPAVIIKTIFAEVRK